MKKSFTTGLFLLICSISVFAQQITPCEPTGGSFYFVDAVNKKVNAFSAFTGKWDAQVFGDDADEIEVIPSKYSFAFVDETNKKVCAFSMAWTCMPYSGSSEHLDLHFNNGNFIFIDDGTKKVNAFNAKTNLWSSMPYSGNAEDIELKTSSN